MNAEKYEREMAAALDYDQAHIMAAGRAYGLLEEVRFAGAQVVSTREGDGAGTWC
jgi:hypothetical protein